MTPTLDRYQLLGELGQGSFGIVYLAFDPKLEREVAIKLVRPQIADDPEVKLRFRREWKAIGRLRHPNIIELLDYADGEWMYLVTERLIGKTLLQLARERLEPFSPVIAAAIVHEVALALENAHEQGIVHRDVKPENIFLEPNGRIVLCDFGIAFAARADETDAVMRGRNTQMLGSPLYMSPEQVAGDGVGPQSDLFSLGAVAYFLACGKDAFSEPTVLGVLKRISVGEHHAFPAELQGTPYAAAVERLLQPDRRKRFADAVQVADAFLEVLRAGGGQGDPRRVLKQQLSSLAQMQTATAGKPLKRLEDVDGDSKTYVTQLLSATHSGETTAAQVVKGLSKTTVSTDAMRATGKSKQLGAKVAIVALLAMAVAAAGVYGTKSPPPVQRTVLGEEPQPRPVALPTPSLVEKPPPLPEEQPEAPPVIAKPERPRPKEAPPPAVNEKGKLRLIVVPWGEVYVDGIRVGVTPEVRELTLAAGPHRVRIVNQDFVAQERTVMIEANDTVKLRVELQ